MKLKHTLILLSIAGLLWGYVTFIDPKVPSTKELAERADRVFTFDRDKISAISIKAPEGKIELKKDGRTWRVTDPVKDRADVGTMSTLLTSVELLRAEQTIDNGGKGSTKEQLKDYGITDSQAKITLTVDGKRVELIFGKDTAVADRVYAMVEGEKSVRVVPSNLRNDISKKVDEFRDRKLSDLSFSQITKTIIKTDNGEIEIEKKDDHWTIVRPLKARGDDSKIGDVISQALAARVDRFVADTSKLAEYGLEQPQGTVTLTVEGQSQPQVVSIGTSPKEEKDKEKVYAKLSSRDAVVLVPKALARILEIKPNDLRDRKLMQFSGDMVDRITLEPAGKEKLVFAREGAKNWVRKADRDLKVNAAAITRVLDDLSAVTVRNFVSDVATELPNFGLDQPALTVTLSAYSSENTAETKAGEKPIVTVLFGKTEGDDVYARLDDEPFIVSIPKSVLEAIPSDAIQVQPLEIFAHKPNDIVALEVVREGMPTLSMDRDKELNWKLAKGDDKLNTINVQSLVNTLASLRTVRWVGTTSPDHGFAKPKAVVSFKTTDGKAGKLTIGGQNREQMQYATAEGTKGTFLLASPDFEAFVSGLTEKPTVPAPTPATSDPATPGAAAQPTGTKTVIPPVPAPPLSAPAQ